jgi:multicomponent K+:H+ antiporter subunit E
MRRIMPYPLLAAALLAMWLLLNGLSVGHFVLGTVIALAASKAVTALEPDKPRIRHWSRIPVLAADVMVDILRSNIAVAGIVLKGRRGLKNSGFLAIPLDLRDKTGLAILAGIITATPGTAWVDYHSGRNELVIHVLDLTDPEGLTREIKNRYERRLMEIFE